MVAVVREQPFARPQDAHAFVGRRNRRNDVAGLAKASHEIVDPARAGEAALDDQLAHVPGRRPGGAVVLVIGGVKTGEKAAERNGAGVRHQPGSEAVAGKQPDQRIDMRPPRRGERHSCRRLHPRQ